MLANPYLYTAVADTVTETVTASQQLLVVLHLAELRTETVVKILVRVAVVR